MSNNARTIKAEIFIHWLHFKLFPDEYGISEIIDHGYKLVSLGRELKIRMRD